MSRQKLNRSEPPVRRQLTMALVRRYEIDGCLILPNRILCPCASGADAVVDLAVNVGGSFGHRFRNLCDDQGATRRRPPKSRQ